MNANPHLRSFAFIRGLFVLLAVLLAACGTESKRQAAPPPKPRDETRRFPATNLIQTKVVDKELMGKPFMPGGTVASYKKGKTEFEMFVCRMPSAADAAFVLPDWRKSLTDAKLIPSFGGYFGKDGDRPMFVFSKGEWVAGVAGLPEKEADSQARLLAARL